MFTIQLIHVVQEEGRGGRYKVAETQYQQYEKLFNLRKYFDVLIFNQSSCGSFQREKFTPSWLGLDG